ncbi:ribbon-helix-helix domain-containing protein [Pannus brasiliensis CCIBt3594]|uniref:Ribbon-helix-helix domain-containing protein n=1 Tax=Pannus brasiliensis CCIBt3594 TaxID=1427578 RepID=A0AAW9QT45_9CHRO
MVLWSLTVSSETDRRLRDLLGQDGDLSRYVEEAVKQKLNFEETVSSVQERNTRYPEEEIEESIQEAIRETRVTSRP